MNDYFVIIIIGTSAVIHDNNILEPKSIAKNVLRLTIAFLNSVLTLRGVPINCRFGFTKLYHLETD